MDSWGIRAGIRSSNGLSVEFGQKTLQPRIHPSQLLFWQWSDCSCQMIPFKWKHSFIGISAHWWCQCAEPVQTSTEKIPGFVCTSWRRIRGSQISPAQSGPRKFREMSIMKNCVFCTKIISLLNSILHKFLKVISNMNSQTLMGKQLGKLFF